MKLNANKGNCGVESAPLVIIDGDKGGIGKSFLGRTLVWMLSNAGVSLVLFDGDERNAHLERYYGGIFPVTRFDARSAKGWTLLFDRIESAPADAVILVDLPAGAGQQLQHELFRLRENEELGTPTVHIWVGDHSEDSVRLFKGLADLAPARQTAFVLNKKDDEQLQRFRIWLNSNARAAFRAEGGLEVTLPRLSPEIHDRIAIGQLPFPTERPSDWPRGHWLSFRAFAAQVDQELRPLLALIEEMRP